MSDDLQMLPARICSHVWIDPTDPSIQRTPYVPMLGPLRRQMKYGREYHCRNCGFKILTTVTVPHD